MTKALTGPYTHTRVASFQQEQIVPERSARLDLYPKICRERRNDLKKKKIFYDGGKEKNGAMVSKK